MESTLEDLVAVIGSGIGLVLIIVLVVRLVGLTSFSKMTSYDFAVTVSVGSILGSVATGSTALWRGAVAVAVLLATQAVIALARSRRRRIESLVDNTPLLLMSDGRFLDDHLRGARLTRADLVAKLREAGVVRLADVRAVVLETTGEVSVLTGDGTIDDALLDGVRLGGERTGA